MGLVRKDFMDMVRKAQKKNTKASNRVLESMAMTNLSW